MTVWDYEYSSERTLSKNRRQAGMACEETVDVPVKARRQRTDAEIQAALKAVERLKVHARDMRKRGLVAKTSADGSMKSAARAEGLEVLV